MIGCAETNITWINKHKQTSKTQAQKSTSTEINCDSLQSIVITSNSATTSNSKHYKQGRTDTIIHKKWTGQYVSKIKNPTGCRRWSGVTLRTHKEK